MNKILSSEELFKKYSNLYHFEEGDAEYLVDKEDFKEAVIEFCKLHVQAALNKANERVKLDNIYQLKNGSILNDYPLDKIK